MASVIYYFKVVITVVTDINIFSARSLAVYYLPNALPALDRL